MRRAETKYNNSKTNKNKGNLQKELHQIKKEIPENE